VEAVEGAGERSVGIGPRLRAARLSRGMSLAALAAPRGADEGLSLAGRASGDDAYGLGSEAEFVHVLAGTLDGEAYRLAEGDSLTFDAGRPRRWSSASPVCRARVVPALR
jgi:hypothetical protein